MSEIPRLKDTQERFKAIDIMFWFEDPEYQKFRRVVDYNEDGGVYYFSKGFVKKVGNMIEVTWAPDDDVFEYLTARTTKLDKAFLWIDDIEKANGNILPPEDGEQ